MVSTHLIICEDIRQETGGKKSLMGVFGSQIICSSLPLQLNQLCFRVSFETPKSRPIKSLELEIAAADEPAVRIPVLEGNLASMLNATKNPESTHLQYILEVVATPFPISKEGPIRVSARVNDRKVRVGVIWVKLAVTEPARAVARKTKGKAKRKAARPHLKRKLSEKA